MQKYFEYAKQNNINIETLSNFEIRKLVHKLIVEESKEGKKLNDKFNMFVAKINSEKVD